MYAKTAGILIHSYCNQMWEAHKANKMPSIVADGGFMDAFDIKSSGSHKYIPTERLNKELEYPQGAGVFGYFRFSDGSYLLRTCDGPLAVWSGKDDEKAERVN